MAGTTTALNILVTASTTQAQAKLGAVDAQMKKMAATSGVSGASLGKMNKGLLVGAGGMAAITGAAVIAGKQLYDLGGEFDRAYDTIRVGTGATGKQLDKLKASFRDVAKDVPNSFEEVGTAVADLNTRLDLTGKPLEKMAENMLHLSNITDTDLKTNIESVSIAFKAWDVPAKNQLDMLNGLYRVGQRSGAAVADLAKKMQEFSSPLRSAGFALDDAAAMFASFQKAGVNVSTMMPGFKLAMGNLTAPTDKLSESLKQLNINTDANPMKNFQKVMGMLSNSNKELTRRQKEQLAVTVFGKRATIDFMDAIRQGRFAYDNYLGVLKNGKDTIRNSADDTYDLSENAKTLGNRLKVLVEPAASGLFDTLGELSGALVDITGPANDAADALDKMRRSDHGGETGLASKGDWLDNLRKKGEDAAAAADLIAGALWALGIAARFTEKVLSDKVGVMKQKLRGLWEMIKGGVQTAKALFHGDWASLWKGAGNVVQGVWWFIKGVLKQMTWGLRQSFKQTDWIMSHIFGGAWQKVKDIFNDGANAVIGIVEKIASVLNIIPGVHINVSSDTFQGNLTGKGGTGAGRKFGHQRGGPIFGGEPSGDSIPAMLERGEYVLNRNAVQKAGVKNLDRFNFGAAPRFQDGGPVGLLNGGDVWGAVRGAAGAVTGAAGKVLGKGASFFIDKLPKPDIPQPFTGVGPWAIKKVTDWIKGNVHAPSRGVSGKGINGLVPQVLRALAFAKGHGWTGSVTSGFRTYAEQAALYQAYLNGTGNLAAPPGTSNHEGGQAVDVSDTEGFAHAMDMMRKGRLYRRIPGEPWHFSVTGYKSGGVVKKVASMLTRRGFDHKAIAGILGNAWGESNWNPASVGSGGGGLWGFTSYEKSLANLQAYAASRGKPWTDVGTQVRFMLKTGGAGLKNALNSMDSIYDTTKYFMDEYERPGIPRLDVRTEGGFMASRAMRGMKLGKGGSEPSGKTILTGGALPTGKGGTLHYSDKRLKRQAAHARKAGIKRGRGALRYSKAVRAEAKNKGLAGRAVHAAKKAVNLAKAGKYREAVTWAEKSRRFAERAAKSIPGLKGHRPPFGTKGYDADKPFGLKNLPGFAKLPKTIQKALMAPGLGWAGKSAAADAAIDLASRTKTKVDDAAAYNLKLGLERGRLKNAQKRFRHANAMLAKGGLTKAQQKRWIKRRNNALDTIGEATGEITSTRSSIRDLNNADSSDADLAASMKELADAIKAQTAMQSSVQATGSREALRMLSDVISGEIVGKRAGVPAQIGVRY